MPNLIVPGQGLVFMKVGVHARESLAEIIERKTKEIDDAGFALWGYGGSTCYPNTMVQPFARDYTAKGQKILLCMQEMESNHYADPVRAEEFSVDGIKWQPVPKPINVLGSRFALAIKSLRREEFELPLSKTRVAVGPSLGRKGDKYIQGRADKACLEMTEEADIPLQEGEPVVQINLIAELCEPYAVFLKTKI